MFKIFCIFALSKNIVLLLNILEIMLNIREKTKPFTEVDLFDDLHSRAEECRLIFGCLSAFHKPFSLSLHDRCLFWNGCPYKISHSDFTLYGTSNLSFRVVLHDVDSIEVHKDFKSQFRAFKFIDCYFINLFLNSSLDLFEQTQIRMDMYHCLKLYGTVYFYPVPQISKSDDLPF